MQPNSENNQDRRLTYSKSFGFKLYLALLGLLFFTQAAFAQAVIVASTNVDGPPAYGAISPSGNVQVTGDSQQFTAAVTQAGQQYGYRFKHFLVTLNSGQTITYYDNPHTVTGITGQAGNSIVAVFDYVYTITPGVSGSGGTISPSTQQPVNYGTSGHVFTITPSTNPPYVVADVKVDDVSVGAVTQYTFNNVTADHTIVASFTPGSHSLTLLFDLSAYPYPDQVWLQAQDNTRGFTATYGNNQHITFNGSNMMSEPVKLSDIGSGGLNVTYASNVNLFVFYDDPTTMDRTQAPAYMTVPQRFMPFELTMTGNPGDQGDLTAINYFTAPLSLSSYSSDPTQNPPLPALQQTGFGKATAGRIAGQLVRNCQRKPNAVVKSQGRIIRMLGPSDAFTPNPNPWPSFVPYTKSVYQASPQQTTSIQTNPQGFQFSDQNPTYSFGADMTATANSDGSLTVTGSITASYTGTIKPGNPTPPASWGDATITFSTTSPGGHDAFNSAIYGSVQNGAVSLTGTAWNNFLQFCQNTLYDPGQPHDPANNPSLADNKTVTKSTFGPNAPAYSTAVANFIGEVTTGLLGGFFNSTTISNYPPDAGKALKDVPSSHWWLQNPIVGFSQIQPQHPYYSLYSAVIYNTSGNTVYSVPYSDRFGTGPLVNSVNYTTQEGCTYYVNYWVIGIGAPLPQPLGLGVSPELLLLLQ